MPSLPNLHTAPGIVTLLKKEVDLLEEKYQSALDNDEKFAVLKDIRNNIKVLHQKISDTKTEETNSSLQSRLY